MSQISDLALLAANSYRSGTNEQNMAPLPEGAVQLPGQFGYVSGTGGFEATAYQYNGQIVIAFTGTNSGLNDAFADAKLGLAIPDAQLKQAAIFYEQVKQVYGSNIVLTGHSLGGGLAALIGVFFNKPAVTFDPAPFRLSATQEMRDVLSQELLVKGFSLDADLMSFTTTETTLQQAMPNALDHLVGNGWGISQIIREMLDDQAFPTVIRGEENIIAIATEGEILTAGVGKLTPAEMAQLRIMGSLDVVPHGGDQPYTDSLHLVLQGVRYHSMPLLATFLAEPEIANVSNDLPDLAPALLNEFLYARPKNSTETDILIRLLTNQNTPGSADVLGNFFADMQKLVGDQGIVQTNERMNYALMVAAMDYYYHKPAADAVSLFQVAGGGLHFKYSDIPSQQIKSLPYLKQAVTDLLSTGEQALAASLESQNAWHVQQGAAPLIWTESESQDDAAIGGAGADQLNGGTLSDVLIGLSGNDTLTGGTGNDTLLGGFDFDTYKFSAGYGTDQILDLDGFGEIFFGTDQLTGGDKVADNVWTETVGGQEFFYTLIVNPTGGQDLYITRKGSTDIITLRNWLDEQLGIDLSDTMVDLPDDYSSPVQQYNPQFELIDVWEPSADWPFGNFVAFAESDTPQLLLTDLPITYNGTSADELLFGGDVYDSSGLVGDSIDGGGGADFILGGLGHDVLNGGEGNDYILGSWSGNYHYGQNVGLGLPMIINGNGWGIYNSGVGYLPLHWGFVGYDTSYTMLDDGNVIDGGGGNDTIHAGNGSDVVHGGDNDDTVFGNARGDTLFGDDGNDTIWGDGPGPSQADIEVTPVDAHGADVIDGGIGNDTLIGQGQSDTLYGGAGNDFLQGDHTNLTSTPIANHGNDYLDGGGDDDTVIGDAGNDLLFGGSGSDFLWGDNSATQIAGQYHGQDRLSGEDGNDQLVGGGNDDVLFGGANDDSLFGDDNPASLDGQYHGSDTLDGGDGFDFLEGGGKNDTLFGGAGNDTLSGDRTSGGLSGTDSGEDYLDGGGDEDVLVGGAKADSLYGGTGNDTLFGDGSVSDVAAADHGDDLLDGGDGIDQLIGNGGSDTLLGGIGTDTLFGDSSDTPAEFQGDDYLDGGEDDDTLVGGGGADILIGGSGGDQIYGEATDTPVAAIGDDTLDGGTGADTLVGAGGSDTLYGGSENDTLFGDSGGTPAANQGDDYLDGGTGADYMQGGGGNDFYVIDDAGDYVAENQNEGVDTVLSAMTHVLGTGVENVTLTGAFTADATGNELGNTLEGNLGANVLSGMAGDDTYIINDLEDTVLESNSQGTDLVQSSITYTLGANLENLTLTGSAAINGTGNEYDNILLGNSGNNTLTGGLGNDTYGVDNAGDTVVENSNEGIDLVQSSVTYVLGTNLENLTLTGTAAVNGTGNANDNILLGNSGINTLTGGAGNDTYGVDNVGDIVVEAAGEGTDLVQSSVTFTLATNFEDLTLTGIAAINGTGNGAANVLTGNAAANTLTGLGGDDTYVVDSADTVVEAAGGGIDTIKSSGDYTLGVDIENLILIGAAITGTGNTLDNVITGSGLANTLTGGGGNDTLNGASGADTLIGGTGNDVYVVDNAADVTTELAAEGTDTVLASADYVLGANVENLTLAGSGSINGTGNSAANTLLGNIGSNRLDGAGGADTLTGGLGNDTYVIDQAGDVINEIAGEGIDTVESSFASTLGANLENLTLIGVSAINGTGNAADNVLTGNSAANTLTGGQGNDTYVVSDLLDTLVENSGEGTDRVSSSVTYSLGANLENLTLTGTSAIDGTGNTLANEIVGNAAVNTLTGLDGADTLSGEGGVDSLVGGNGDDLLLGESATTAEDTAGSDALDGGAGVDTLIGGGGADNLLGGSENDVLFGDGDFVTSPYQGDDLLDGGAGIDAMAGGGGNDTYVVDNVGDSVFEASNQGTDTVQSSQTYTLGNDIENLTLIGAGAINGTGNFLANVLTGNSAANILTGGGGNDTYIVDSTADALVEEDFGGTDTVQSSATYTLGNYLENLTLIGAGAINGTGNALDNVLTGNIAANTLTGGVGNDTYVIGAGDTIVENAGEGTDSVQSSITYTLGAALESLTLTGASAINGTGNASDNVLTGNSAANTLTGLGGNDTYVVDGTDTVVEASGAGTDTVQSSGNYTLGSNVENLLLTGSGSINGTGNALDNILTGNNGVNTLTGGAGNDTYIIGFGGDAIVESVGQGTDTVQTVSDYTLGANLENLVLTGGNGVNATGNSAINTLTGNTGGNTLDGGSGADSLIGGLGNDTYVVDNTGDTITELTGEGTDSVQSSVAFILGNFVENLTLTGSSSVAGTGNALDNILTGNVGTNTLTGGAGNDTYVIGAGDSIVESSGQGTDLVQSSVTHTLAENVENLTLTGGSAINGTGNALDNVLAGNAAANTLTGGAGNDTYVIGSADTAVENASEGTDTVESSVSYSLGNNVENLTLTGASALNGSGNSLDNVLTGNSGANTLTGFGGNDTYVVNSSDTVVEAAGGGTDLVRSSSDWTLGSNFENLEITGGGFRIGTGNSLDNNITGGIGTNTLYGLDGNDTLNGGGGTDTLVGGIGNDTFVVDSADDVVTENASEGTDLVQSSTHHTLAVNVENLTLTGAFNVDATGNTQNNVLTGNTGNNRLNGRQGADSMLGGAGNDTYVIDDAGDTITENASEGTDTAESSISYTIASNVENVTLTGTSDLNATGNSGDNYISGNLGNNVLTGGAGNDTYVVSTQRTHLYWEDSTELYNFLDTVTEAAGGGYDTIIARYCYSATLSANAEKLVIEGLVDYGVLGFDTTQDVRRKFTGNALDNVVDASLASSAGVDPGYIHFPGGFDLSEIVIDGGAGADQMVGANLLTRFMVDNVGDTVAGGNRLDDRVESTVSFTLGTGVEILELKGSSAISGTGNAADNIFYGNTNTAANVLTGLSGNDTYYLGAGDSVVEAASAGTDTLNLTAGSVATYLLSSHANVENLTIADALGASNISGTSADNVLTGNTSNNTLAGSGGNDTLNGGGGLDTLQGGQGNDTLSVDSTNDVVTENAGEGTDTVRSLVTWTLGANLENLTLTGGDAINGTGNTLDNVLTGNTAANTLTGATGNDTYVIGAGDTVVENASEGTDTVQSSLASYTLGANVENLILLSGGHYNGTGNSLGNTLTGNSYKNVLDGAGGSDQMSGGAGDDTYVVDVAGDGVTENASEGTDLVQADIAYTLGNNVENLTLSGSNAINGTGNALDNRITGNSGVNVLTGGAGNDTYVVGAGDSIVEVAGGGTDNVESAVTFTLSAEVENLTLTGATAVNGTGNGVANIMLGNSAVNVLTGGAGNDTYGVDNATDSVVEAAGEGTDTVNSTGTYSLGANVENLNLTGITTMDGTGNDLANAITGNAEANVLNGGLGADTLTGGLGNDTYVVDNLGDVVVEVADQGADLVQSSVSVTLSTGVESLSLTGSLAINGIGNTQTNVLTGNSNNNTLDGGAGADTMSGGTGNDIYVIDNASDSVTELAGEGTDEVRSSINYTLGANVENLTLIGSSLSVDATGNTLDNTIFGNLGFNRIDGGAGADTMHGGDGNDTYIVDDTGDTVTENANEGEDAVESSVTFTLAANIEKLTLTGASAIDGKGNASNNSLFGNSADNVLDGGAGKDFLVGGQGNDTYIVDSSTDSISEQSGGGTDVVQASASFTLSNEVEQLILTGTGAINATGSAQNNTLTGNSGANVLNGGVGADTMAGGSGDDTYVVDSYGDSITESADSGLDTVNSSVTHTLAANVENLTLTGFDAIDGTGNQSNNVITGNFAVNILSGGGGNDTIDGGAGADSVLGGAGDDSFVVDDVGDSVSENANEGSDTILSSVSFTLGSNIENLTLAGSTAYNATGNVLDNVLTGNDLDNVINGAGGVDTMIGGLGSDTYFVDQLGETVTESLDEGTDVVQSLVSYVLNANVENLTLIGSASVSGTGNDLNNTISGNASVNTLDGGGGQDVLSGGQGNDTYVVDGSDDSVQELYAEGTDTVQSSVAYMLGEHVENIVLTGTSSIDATGNSANNQLIGNTGDNVLDGNTGVDSLIGGAGNDTYVVDESGDTVTEASGEGTDLVRSSVTYTLGNNVENLTLMGYTAIDGTGNSLANVLTGNDGNNVLDGGVGADTLVGGYGDDTYIVDVVGDTVTENDYEGTDLVKSAVAYTLGTGLDHLELTGTASVNGTGNELANSLTGNSGNNILNGGAAADTMIGGGGNDTYVVDDTSDIVTESAGQGTDLVQASVSYTLSSDFENLTLAGSAASGTGNSSSNIITGNSSDNTLDGAEGMDTLIGGAGHDTYIVDNTSDVVTEASNAGTDTVQASATFTLGSNVEHLTLTGSDAINGTGNTLANTLTGNSGNNTLSGGTGADSLIGGAGSDSYVVDNAGDAITENGGEGIDHVQSSVTHTLASEVENLTLGGSSNLNGTGNYSDNVLTGNSGNNTLDGVSGTDTLIGGVGNDIYVVDDELDVVTENASAGTDLVRSSAYAYTLGQNLENLTLIGTGTNGTGNDAVNTVTGNIGDNTLDGGLGVDILVGGAGNDTYLVDGTTETVTEGSNAGTDLVQSSATFTLGSNVENLTLMGEAAINGTGNTLVNTIIGNSAANTLSGGTGADTLIGGAGDDTYVVDNANDALTEYYGEGVDLVQTTATYTMGGEVENLTLMGTSGIGGTGNWLDNILTGNTGNNALNGDGGNDIIDGGTGNDTMAGGYGDDVFYVNAASDVTNEGVSEGTDLVHSAVTRTLASNIELLFLSGATAINGTGNALDNLLRGNTMNNTLAGAAGVDILEGGDGNDTLSDSGGNTLLNGGAGTDTLTGTASSDLLIGGAGNDALTTGAGADLIVFNKGDGQDTVAVSTTRDNTVALGGTTVYADLLFEKSGNNLILKIGATDQITFTNYYASASNRSVDKLQIVIEGTSDYDSGSSDVTRNQKIETFDFEGLVAAFDAALVANPSLTTWALTNALTAQHLSGSDTAAIGGDLAYRYGRFGNLSDLSFTPALGILGSGSFGSTEQALQDLSSLQDSSPRLG